MPTDGTDVKVRRWSLGEQVYPESTFLGVHGGCGVRACRGEEVAGTRRKSRTR